MKSFFKIVIANIVAFMLIGLLIVIGFFAMILLGSLSDTSTKINKNSVLTLNFKTNIIDSPTEEEQSIFNLNKKSENVMLLDILDAINKAKTDDNIKGISIETDNINAGMTQLDNIRTALEDFKKSGKFVYAYGNAVSQPAYYLGSVADKYYLNPSGGIELKGMASEVTFFKDFADKYGIGIEVIRHGKFKAAVEPFLRNEISPENKEQLSTLLNDIWDRTSSSIYKSRKINPEEFKTIVDSLYGVIPDLSLKYRLADQLIQKGEYDNLIKQKINLKADDKLNKVSFNKYINSLDTDSESNQIGLLYASGEINSGEGYNNIYSETLIKEIKKLKDNEKIKAVVLRVNSPGGSANASDEILFELQQLKKKKPLIVSFGNYAASGGYYISMAADKIYSEPNTITGSIGVFGLITYAKEIANKNGIRADVVSTNANSNMYSMLNGITPGTVSIMQRSVEGTYSRFVHFVTLNRKKSFEEIDAVGGGRVWSGTSAKKIGLVDELGSLTDAVKYAAKQAKLDKYSISSYPAKSTPFEQFFKNMNEDEVSAKLIKSKIGADNYKIFQHITDPKAQSGIMMQLPYDISIK